LYETTFLLGKFALASVACAALVVQAADEIRITIFEVLLTKKINEL
jgi:hypothetical protein